MGVFLFCADFYLNYYYNRMKVTVSIPEFFDKNYPDWKKNLWGAFRAFIAGFFSSLGVHLLSITGDNLVNPEWWLHVVLIGSVTGGIIYLGKWLRDKFPESEIIQKIPF